jgi:hypothetical protein
MCLWIHCLGNLSNESFCNGIHLPVGYRSMYPLNTSLRNWKDEITLTAQVEIS